MKFSHQCVITMLSLGFSSLALAAPGAHGPDGEHLDAKGAAQAGATTLRVEARSESFELVAQVRGNELTVFVDRYDTNEPVLGAKLDIESGPHKAGATFRADAGDYVVADAQMLKALATPGEHPLIFTLVAGKDADLLEGTLVTPKNANDDHAHDHWVERVVMIGAAAALILAATAWWMRRRRSSPFDGDKR